MEQAIPAHFMADEFSRALVALVGEELAERYSRKFEPLEREICLGVLGYEALAMFVYTTPMEWHERINRELWNDRPSNDVLVSPPRSTPPWPKRLNEKV